MPRRARCGRGPLGWRRRTAGAGNLGGAPASFVLIGEAHLAAGQPGDALGVVDMGLALSAQTGQAFFDAELHRLRGEIWLRRSGDGPEPIESEKRAEACFHDALNVAIAQELKPFELRAATSLARLWRDQGKCAEARDLLDPVYNWFTEGLDTRDLVEAKALLEEL